MSLSTDLAESNGWPLLRTERGFGKVAIFLAAFSAAMATWCFTIGGFVAYYLSATPGTWAILAGALLGILAAWGARAQGGSTLRPDDAPWPEHPASRDGHRTAPQAG